MEDSAEQRSRTLFVKGISYGVEKDSLEDAFTAVGPVRNCFIVRTKGETQHKGCGYVQFALREDAAAALKQLQHTVLGGRKIKVEFAAARAPFSERKRKADVMVDPGTGKAIDPEAGPDQVSKAAAATKQPTGQTSEAKKLRTAPQQPMKRQPRTLKVKPPQPTAKQQLVMTVAIGGIPAGQQAAVQSLAAAAGKVASVDDAPSDDVIRGSKLREDGCLGDPLFIAFTSVKDAGLAVAALHRRALGESRLWARQVSGEGQHHKKWRLIVRNLSFKVTDEELKKHLSSAGFVWDAKIVRDNAGASRGFGFASFTCRGDAEKAVQECNMKAIGGRTVAVDWAVAKAQYQAAGQDAAAAAAKDVPPDSDAESSGGSSRSASELDSDDEEADERDTNAKELPISDEREMQRSLLASMLGIVPVTNKPGVKSSGAQDENEVGMEDASDVASDMTAYESEDGDSGSDRGADTTPHRHGTAVGAAAATNNDNEDDDDLSLVDGLIDTMPVAQSDLSKAPDQKPEATQSKKPSHSQPPCAVATAGKEAVAQPVTVVPAVRLLTEAERLLQRQAAQMLAPPRQPKPIDPGESAATTVFVRGLPAAATEAVLREVMAKLGPLKACRMVVDKVTQQPKGTAFVEFRNADSAARAALLGKGDRGAGLLVCGQKVLADVALSKDDARALALNKGTLGKAGADRRNLYLAVEGQIREGDAAWELVPAGDRPRRKRAAEDKALKLKSPNFSISRTRLAVRNIPASMDEATLKKLALKAVLAHASKAQPRVKQAKILMEETAAGGGGRGHAKSRGRGFVEFTEHEHAMAALRHLNNNPIPFGSQHRPIVEFAIDDMQKLLKRRQRLDQPKRPAEHESADGRRVEAPPSQGSSRMTGRGQTDRGGRGGRGSGRGRGGKPMAARNAAARADSDARGSGRGRGRGATGGRGRGRGVQKPKFKR